MNKNELIRQIHNIRGGSLTETKSFVDTFIAVVTEEISHDREVSLQGFGALRPWHQTARIARNPQTGITVPLVPRLSVKFRPGKYLLEALNKK